MVRWIGNRGYAHPKQLSEGKATVKHDLFSFGQVLRALARGKHPTIDINHNRSVLHIRGSDPPLYIA